jgi:hypothetical protein
VQPSLYWTRTLLSFYLLPYFGDRVIGFAPALTNCSIDQAGQLRIESLKMDLTSWMLSFALQVGLLVFVEPNPLVWTPPPQ